MFSKVNEEKEGSDHCPVLFSRSLKNSTESQDYLLFRNMNKYNQKEVELNLIKGNRQNQIFMSNNPNKCAKLLVDMVNDSLKGCAPIKKFIKKKQEKNEQNLSKKTLDLIESIEIQKLIVKNVPNDIVEKSTLQKLKKKSKKLETI